MKQYAALALLTLVACGHRADEDDVIPSKSCTVSPTGLVSCPDGSSFQIPKPEQGVKGDKGDVGQDGQNGQDGAVGPMGPQGLPGAAGLSAVSISVSASRFYGPSNWSDFTATLPPNTIVQVPAELPLTTGAAGTGWTRIDVAGYSYCFQGDGANNSQPGTKWVLKHVRTGTDCLASGGITLPAAPVLVSTPNAPSTLKLSIQGGGVASSLQITTTITTNLSSFRTN